MKTLSKKALVAFEKDIAEHFNRGEIRAPIHLSGGNEDNLIQIFKDIKQNDWVFSTWRSHYHCLLKGVSPEQLKADILAGKSITLCYPEHRILSSAIVGGICPIALGVAWSIKRAKKKNHVWVFVGDMAHYTGIYQECERYASGHGLPLTFVVEDNGISVCTPTEAAWGEVETDVKQRSYRYKLKWPHSGAGVRVSF